MKTIKAKIHRLPTEIKAKDWRQQIVVLKDGTGLSVNNTENHQNKIEILSLLDATCIPQYLYITTDEKPRVGEWCLSNGDIFQATKEMVDRMMPDGYTLGMYPKKIIATTDSKLIADGVAEIEQSFIEEYCKAGGIDEVLVEVENYEILKARQLGVNSHLDAINSINSSIFPQPKLNPDNTIIIHPVEEKMIPVSKVKELMILSINFGKGFCGSDGQRDKWIEENL